MQRIIGGRVVLAAVYVCYLQKYIEASEKAKDTV